MSDHRTTERIATAFLLTLALLAAAPLAAGDSRWYLAGSAGQASVQRDFGSPTLGWRVDGSELTANLDVGYALRPHFALQAGYRDLGSGTFIGLPRPCPPDLICPLSVEEVPQLLPAYPTPVDFTGWTLAAVPSWSLADRVDLYGKLGLLDWRADVRRDPFGDPIPRPSGTDLLAGAGARYALTQALGLQVEYETSDLVDAFSIGAVWRF